MTYPVATDILDPLNETSLAVDELGGTLPHPADPEPDDLAIKVRNWFVMARNHPLWNLYIKYADEDEGFYIGGDLQWSKEGSFESLNRLKRLRKTYISLNQIQSTVDVLVGFERQNRFDLKATPQGNEDAESARILSWILKFVQDQTELQEYESEMFGDGLIRGASAIEVGVDFAEDPGRPRIDVGVLIPGKDCIWDPYSKKYDLSDARFVLKYQWAYVADLIQRFPAEAEAIRQGVAIMDAIFSPYMATTDGPSRDAYGSTLEHVNETLQVESLFYSPIDRRILVVEAWYREYQPAYLAVNHQTGKQIEVESAAEAKEIVAADPKHWHFVRKDVRRIRTGTVLPATRQVLEEGDTPYDNDAENYPIVPYIAKKKGHWMYGIVRNMKDPQIVENKRMSQVLDILARWANIRPLVPKNSLDDPRILEDHHSTAPIVYNQAIGAPSWYAPQGLREVALGLIEVATQTKLQMREITGINTDLLGLKGDDTSGIAIARRQAQGQIIATIFFDNFKRTRKIVGQRLSRRIQQVFTTEEVLRLIDDETGEPITITVNPVEAKAMPAEKYEEWAAQKRDAQGRPLILRDLQALKYDVVISDAPSTPSARATALLALLELLGKMPAILPAVIDVVLELADISDKPKILRRVRNIMEAQGMASGDDPAKPGAPMPSQTASVPGAAPEVQPPGMAPTVTAGRVPSATRGRPSSALRRTMLASTGGAPIGATV